MSLNINLILIKRSMTYIIRTCISLGIVDDYSQLKFSRLSTRNSNLRLEPWWAVMAEWGSHHVLRISSSVKLVSDQISKHNQRMLIVRNRCQNVLLLQQVQNDRTL